MTFEVDENVYELRYDTKRTDMIESVTQKPLMVTITQNGGVMARVDLINYLAYGIKEEGKDIFVMPKQGREIAERMIQKEGYAKCLGMVLETLQEDCGFFFRSA